MKSPHFNELRIQGFVLQVSLGCSADERAQLQEVRIDVRVRRAEVPKACYSDQLQEADCYARICEALTQVGKSRPFFLIESMGREMYEAVLATLAPNAQIQVRIHKVHPPVMGLEGGSHFICGDFE